MEADVLRNCLVFQPTSKYFQKISSTDHISKEKSKGLSDGITKPSTTLYNNLAPELSCFVHKIKVKFNGSCVKQDKVTYNHSIIVNIFIVDKLSSNLNNFNFALEYCLFGAFKLTKNGNMDK